MRRKKKSIMNLILPIVLIITVSLVSMYFIGKKKNSNNNDNKVVENNGGNESSGGNEVDENNNDNGEDGKNKGVGQEDTIKISSLGNIIFHDKQLQGAKTNKGYDFSESFKYVKDKIEGADLGIAVLETTLQGNGNYTGFPVFNSPDEVLTALKDSGVNMINYGTNHIWDGGIDALTRTVQVTKEQGIDVTGVRESVNEPRYEIKEIKGQKIGMISYVFETGIVNGQSTINSIPISESSKALLNTFDYGKLDEFYTDLQGNMDKMKSEGADFIMVGMHWGEEYNNNPNSYQTQIAEKLNEMGVDIVLGNHPHVIQPYEIMTNAEGKKTFVIYGQGNNLSNQCAEELDGDARTEDGYIVNFELAVGDDGLSIKKYDVIPLWMYRERRDNGLYTHRMIPLDGSGENDIPIPVTSGESSASASLQRTEEVLGKGKIGMFEFK